MMIKFTGFIDIDDDESAEALIDELVDAMVDSVEAHNSGVWMELERCNDDGETTPPAPLATAIHNLLAAVAVTPGPYYNVRVLDIVNAAKALLAGGDWVGKGEGNERNT